MCKGRECKVCGLLQHPNICNPNKSKKASVLGPAWHKLQPPCVCSVVQTLFGPTECISPGSSVHGILQARILGCHFLLQGNLTHPRIKPLSPILQADSLPLSLLGIPQPSSELNMVYIMHRKRRNILELDPSLMREKVL